MNNEARKIKVKYYLTKEAQKKLIAQGQPAHREREIEIYVDDDLLFSGAIGVTDSGELYLAGENCRWYIRSYETNENGIKYKKYVVDKSCVGLYLEFDHIPSEDEVLMAIKSRTKKYCEERAKQLTEESYRQAKEEKEKMLKEKEEIMRKLFAEGKLYFRNEQGQIQKFE